MAANAGRCHECTGRFDASRALHGFGRMDEPFVYHGASRFKRLRVIASRQLPKDCSDAPRGPDACGRSKP
jgi:hypothetical protein